MSQPSLFGVNIIPYLLLWIQPLLMLLNGQLGGGYLWASAIPFLVLLLLLPFFKNRWICIIQGFLEGFYIFMGIIFYLFRTYQAERFLLQYTSTVWLFMGWIVLPIISMIILFSPEEHGLNPIAGKKKGSNPPKLPAFVTYNAQYPGYQMPQPFYFQTPAPYPPVTSNQAPPAYGAEGSPSAYFRSENK